METIAAINDAETRARYAGPAVRAFLNLAKAWKLSQSDQIDLLGASVTRQTLGNWAVRPPATLSADELMRISYLLGVFEGIQRIWRHAPDEADQWIHRSRREPPFYGVSPLEFMRRGIPALEKTRAYVDGVTGGPPSREDYLSPPREAE
jgi:hypothetical protein